MNCTRSNFARSLRAAVVRTCLLSLGLSLGAGFASHAATAPVKCPTGQAYNAVTKKCGTAPTAATTPGAVKKKSAGGAVRQPTSSTIPNLSKGKLPPAPPNISSINPPGGQAGTTVTIDGTGFAAGATVSVGDAQLGMAQATKVTLVSPTQLTAVLPPGRSLSTNTATTLNVQVTVAGQTRKAVLFSYCSNVTEYDPARKICVPLGPTCGTNCPHSCPSPLVFNATQTECVPAPPVVCAQGQIFSAQQKQCIPQPAGTFEIVEFVIGTGGDNIELGSYATAVFPALKLPDGNPFICTLHDRNAATWPNNSTNTAICFLHDVPVSLAQLKSGSILIEFDGRAPKASITNPVPGTDNWNLQSVTVNAYNQGQPATCVFSASGDPLFRFTFSATSVVLTDFPNGC